VELLLDQLISKTGTITHFYTAAFSRFFILLYFIGVSGFTLTLLYVVVSFFVTKKTKVTKFGMYICTGSFLNVPKYVYLFGTVENKYTGLI
jgi:hypothetical protein